MDTVLIQSITGMSNWVMGFHVTCCVCLCSIFPDAQPGRWAVSLNAGIIVC